LAFVRVMAKTMFQARKSAQDQMNAIHWPVSKYGDTAYLRIDDREIFLG
jgi:hypothetical protein